MLKNTLCAAAIGSLGLVPMTAGSTAAADAALMVTPLGMAIASQGNEALRAIQHEALARLRSLKPAPLEALVQKVNREETPTEVAQALAL